MKVNRSHAIAFIWVLGSALTYNVHAIEPNVYVPGQPVVNPQSGQATDVWRFVGSAAGCSAVQITREWVVASGHCALMDETTFKNGWSGSTGGSQLDCDEVSDGGHFINTGLNLADISICRLRNPERFNPTIPFPALSAVAKITGPISERGLGTILQVGTSVLQPTISMAFSSTIFSRKIGGNSFTLNDLDMRVKWQSGDSGGGIYWFADRSNTPVLIGGVGWVYDPDFIRRKILARGDALPIFLTEVEMENLSTRRTPPALTAPPVIKQTAVDSATVSWQAPNLGSGDSIDDYIIYNGAIGGTPSVGYASSSSRSATFTPAPNAPSQKVCVAPRKAELEAVSTKNCSEFSSGYPVASNLSVVSTGTTAIKTVTMAWLVNPAPMTTRSQLSYSIRSTTGTVRSGSTSTDKRSFTIGVTAGSQLCFSVKPSTDWATGVQQTTCQLIQ